MITAVKIISSDGIQEHFEKELSIFFDQWNRDTATDYKILYMYINPIAYLYPAAVSYQAVIVYQFELRQ